MRNESDSRPASPGSDVARTGSAQAATTSGENTDLTQLLRRMQSGEPGAGDALAQAVYDDLQAMARAHLSRDVGHRFAGVTIQPTMLTNDTLMKLIRQRQQFDGTGHFFAIASRLMTRVLLDYHRVRNAQKRGRAVVHVSLEPGHHNIAVDESVIADEDVDVEAFSAALDRLAELDARKADVVRYRVLWGLTVPEIGTTLNIGTSTVDRDWLFARAWLTRELQAS